MTSNKDQTELDELTQLRKDLNDSFESFRTVPRGYSQGTSASSQLAADHFINRVLAYARKENESLINRHIEAVKKEYESKLAEADLPWPTDIFGEVPEEDWAKINEFAKRELGYSVDRISGDLMRHGWKVRQRQLNEAIAELKSNVVRGESSE